MKVLGFSSLLLLLSCGGGVVKEDPPPPNGAVPILPGDSGAVCHQDLDCTNGLICLPPSGTGTCSSAPGASPGQIKRDAALNAVGRVGYPCQVDVDCKNGLECLRPAGTVASASVGVCSKACTTGELERSCGADQGGICAAIGESRFCLAACGSGPFACATGSCAQVDAAQVCIPACLSDSQCTTACDLQTGLCTTTPQRGVAAVGAKCTSPADCKTGVCAESRCTGPCNLGGTSGCGENQIYLSGVGGAMCFPLDPQNYFVGNPGECVQSCNCDSNCSNPDTLCEPMEAQLYNVLGLFYGARGRCVARSSAPGKGTPQCSL